MKIYIQGYANFEEWRAAGYPGAVNGNTGLRNPSPARRVVPPPKPSCSVPTCERKAWDEHRGLCYLHYESRRVREARERARATA